MHTKGRLNPKMKSTDESPRACSFRFYSTTTQTRGGEVLPSQFPTVARHLGAIQESRMQKVLEYREGVPGISSCAFFPFFAEFSQGCLSCSVTATTITSARGELHVRWPAGRCLLRLGSAGPDGFPLLKHGSRTLGGVWGPCRRRDRTTLGYDVQS